MAPLEPARWRRRLLLAGLAAAIVLMHGWGLSTVGLAAAADADLPVRPGAFTVRTVPLLPVQQPVAAPPAPVLQVPKAQAAAPQPVPAAGTRQAEPAVQVVDARADADTRADDDADADADATAADAQTTPAAPVPDEHADLPPAPAPAEAPPPPAGTGDAPEAAAPQPGDSAVLLAAAAPVQPARAEPAVEVPVYATRLPAAFAARYRLQRGMLAGTGSLRWAPAADGRRYEARLEGSVAGFNVLDWTSTGAIDRAGVAPERFLIRRRGRDAQAANFQRAAGKITYSGPSVQYELPAGTQDRLSWMLQIGGVLNAAPKRFSVGSRLTFFVSGARGDADVWHFNVVGLEAVQAGGARETMALKLEREPRKPYDTHVEVWLDPAREHRPVLARLSTNGNDDALELRMAE